MKNLDINKKEDFEKYKYIKEININDLNIFNNNVDYISQQKSSLKNKLLTILTK